MLKYRMFEEMEDSELNNTKTTPHAASEKERFAIEDDSDTLEPFDHEIDQREINADDEKDLRYWAEQFLVSPDLLIGAIAVNVTPLLKLKNT